MGDVRLIFAVKSENCLALCEMEHVFGCIHRERNISPSTMRRITCVPMCIGYYVVLLVAKLILFANIGLDFTFIIAHFMRCVV